MVEERFTYKNVEKELVYKHAKIVAIAHRSLW